MTSSKAVKIDGVLLAAGASTRLGQSKQLLKIGETTLLASITDVLIASALDHVIVVLGSQTDVHRTVIDKKSCQIATNPNWSKGMGTSVKHGVSELLSDHPDLDGIALFVCDQVAISSAYVNELIERFRSDQTKIVASSYDGIVGVPCIFPQSLFAELQHIGDQQGAKTLLQKHSLSILKVDFPEGQFDIDTPEDLERLNC